MCGYYIATFFSLDTADSHCSLLRNKPIPGHVTTFRATQSNDPLTKTRSKDFESAIQWNATLNAKMKDTDITGCLAHDQFLNFKYSFYFAGIFFKKK